MIAFSIKNLSIFAAIIGVALLGQGCMTSSTKGSLIGKNDDFNASKAADSDPVKKRQYVFGWGMVPHELAVPIGGTTRGSEVVYSKPKAPISTRVKSNFEKDRDAILSLAGQFKVDFHFMEILGLTDTYKPRRSYNSWGTEHVQILADTGKFISLQHTLVMYFDDDDGPSSPMVMKHWRQDWQYEDKTIFAYQGDLTWRKETYSNDYVKGTWSQAVFQVDDSPRYEVQGTWEHRGNMSRWVSRLDSRPLPRREFSQRSDYGMLEGEHEITLTPTGWVHEQSNLKRVKLNTSSSPPKYLSKEIGINRYERIDFPNLESPSNEYWLKSGEYWKAVRKVWDTLRNERNKIELLPKVDGQSQYMYHFINAESNDDVHVLADETIKKFIK
mgnify:FL=1